MRNAVGLLTSAILGFGVPQATSAADLPVKAPVYKVPVDSVACSRSMAKLTMPRSPLIITRSARITPQIGNCGFSSRFCFRNRGSPRRATMSVGATAAVDHRSPRNALAPVKLLREAVEQAVSSDQA
jgi:hypothetical protein